MDNVEKIDLAKVDWKSSKEFFESLTSELEKLEYRDESYDFTWVGKRKVIIEAGRPINKILRPDIDASKDFDNTKNVLIIGDNLDALKILQESYLGQVKMIYIDPPYNTGHDFVYHDNFSVKKDDYEDNSISEDGERIVSEDEFAENSKSNGRFHSDWLSMMYPRLKLARNLLSDDGAIFISIDDNEQANLKKVCDEIFGEENFVASLVWNTKNASKGVPPVQMITSIHEYVLVYTKSAELFKFMGIERTTDDFSNPDNDPRGLWRKEALVSTISQKSFEIVDPKTGHKFNRPWAFSINTISKMINEGRVLFPPDENGTPLQKKFFDDYTNENLPITTQLGTYQTRKATSDLISLLGNKKIFDFSKPISLLKHLIKQGANDSSLILDFFAGSGTTGHAVMDLNAEDSGNRKYILVQWPEETNEKSEARKAGYETIDQITAERLRRAGEKVQKEHPDAKIDTGFRVFRIDDSNEKENIRKSLEAYTQESMLDMVDNLKSDRTPLDLLFGAIYASALPFDLHLETRKIGDNTVYLYGHLGENSGLAACFDNAISDNAIQEIAKLKPIAAVFRDSSFADSAAKINLSEHFRILSVDTKVKVI